MLSELCCVTCAVLVLEAIRRMQEQKGNGYSANVKDGSMKTVLTVIQVKHSVHFVDFSTQHKVFMKLYW